MGEEPEAERFSDLRKGTKVRGSGEQIGKSISSFMSVCHLGKAWMVKLKAKMSLCREGLH